MAAKSLTKTNRIHTQRVFDVPLREVSGICWRRGEDGRMWLVAVGDRAATVACYRLPTRDETWSDEWSVADLSRVDGTQLPARDPQLEAVCADGAGRVLLLQETPPRAVLVDVESSQAVASISLEINDDGELSKAWADPQGSRGEGAVLLENGHLLVAKEKHPNVLIEFGPRGASPQGFSRGCGLKAGVAWPISHGEHCFIPLAVWRPDKVLDKVCSDFSDLEIGADGRLYVLSDKSATIARLQDLPPGGGEVGLVDSWELVDIDAKAEGLAFAATGHAIVALDRRKAKNNLVLFEPPIAAAT